MKHLITTAIIVALVGCTNSKTDQPITSDTVELQDAAQAAQTINFTGPYDLTIELSTTDNFQTATLQDNSDKAHQLAAVQAANGIKLENEDGVSIHFRNNNGINEGTLELVKGSPIEITEFKEE